MRSLKLYNQIADWWHLFSPPSDYRDEARYHARVLKRFGTRPARTLLELGSGGGNSAFHLKRRFQMTLVDLSPGMSKLSRTINPECQHVIGDMRTVRLGRTFDRVFVHDAIMYMKTPRDLLRVFRTAQRHLRPGGAALFAPDFIQESYQPLTHHGGTDGPDRGIRYLEWNFDPDPADETYEVHFAYMMREPDGRVTTEHDRHIFGLFPRATWLRLLEEAGFQPVALDEPVLGRDVFIGVL